MDFGNNSFVCQTGEYLSYLDNTSPPSTGSSSSYCTAFPYPPFSQESITSNSLSSSCLVQTQGQINYESPEEWNDYTQNDQHFQSLWSNNCDLNITQLPTNPSTDKKK